MAEEKVRSVDKATIELLEKAEKEKISTAFFRAEALKPCPIGVEESCCKICAMGPCRMPKSKKAGEEKDRMGVCGATARPGFFASVPWTNTKLFGLIQNSSTRSLPSSVTRCRSRKLCRFFSAGFSWSSSKI